MTGPAIIEKLPYGDPFLFVDKITHVDASSIAGEYHFRKDSDFYRGHFVNNPVTPGVILLECMAQIGLVSHGIFLLSEKQKPIPTLVAFTSADVQFTHPVLPEDRVEVTSNLVYFRMGKIKSKVELKVGDSVACSGTLSGMMR